MSVIVSDLIGISTVSSTVFFSAIIKNIKAWYNKFKIYFLYQTTDFMCEENTKGAEMSITAKSFQTCY